MGRARHLRAAARAEPRRAVWSFVDGPVTANKTLAIHTAWGRTLKDVFQRYKALRDSTSATRTGSTARASGSRSVSSASSGSTRSGRSRSTGSRSSRASAARRSSGRRPRSRGARSASASGWTGATTTSRSPTRTSSTSGGSSARCTTTGSSTSGHRSTEWCPRCGTSISAHELVGSYEDRTDPSLFVRFPLLDRPGSRSPSGPRRPGRSPRTWRRRSTPTPSTGAATDGEWVAVAARPARGLRRAGQRRRPRRPPLRGPVRPASRRAGDRAPGHPLGRRLAGGGHRHRPHRPGLRRRGLRALARPRPARARARGRGRPLLPGLSAGCTARARSEAAEQIVVDLGRARAPHRRRGDRAPLPLLLALPHAAHLPHRRRLVHRGRRAAPEAGRRQRDRQVDARTTSASAWRTGSATWATGTSRGAATTACRSRSTRATAAT